MDKATAVVNILGVIVLVVWVRCLCSWIKRGVSIPRYVHLLAGILMCISVGCMMALGVARLAAFRLVFVFLFVPSVATYFGWFWMFGPELTGKDKKNT